MEEFKGTKGEWKIKHSVNNLAFNIIGTIHGGRYKVARVPYHIDVKFSSELNDKEKLEAEHNAKLIAAAPDLLDACMTVVSGYEGDGMEQMGARDEVFYKYCKLAINKALGK